MAEREVIGSYEAKTHLPRLLREVAAGREYVITINGKPVARLTGVGAEREDAAKTVAAIRRLRKGIRLAGLSVRDLIDEGRRE